MNSLIFGRKGVAQINFNNIPVRYDEKIAKNFYAFFLHFSTLLARTPYSISEDERSNKKYFSCFQHKNLVIFSATSSLYPFLCVACIWQCGCCWHFMDYEIPVVWRPGIWLTNCIGFSHLADTNLNENYDDWLMKIGRLECSCCAPVTGPPLEPHSINMKLFRDRYHFHRPPQ